MAGSNSFDELRREVSALLSENEELKQMVKLLLENQEMRNVIRNQLETHLTPALESTRTAIQDIPPRAPFLSTSSWDRRDFSPEAGTRTVMRRPLVLLSPVNPAQAGATAFTFPRPRSRIAGVTDHSGGQAAAGFFTPDNAHRDSRFGSNAAGSRSGAQGHSVKCSSPIHPQQRALFGSALSPGGRPVSPIPRVSSQRCFGFAPDQIFTPTNLPDIPYAATHSLSPISLTGSQGSAPSSSLSRLTYVSPDRSLPPTTDGVNPLPHSLSPILPIGSPGSNLTLSRLTYVSPDRSAFPFASSPQGSAFPFPPCVRLSQADSVFGPARSLRAGGQALPVPAQDSREPLPINIRLSQADSVFGPARSLRAGGQAQDFGGSFPHLVQFPIADSVLGAASAPAMVQPYAPSPLNLPTSLSAPGQLGALATSPQIFTFGLQEGPVVYPTTHPALTDALAGTIESGSFSVPSSQGSAPRAIGQASAASSSLFPFGQPFASSPQGSAFPFPPCFQLSQADSVFGPARSLRAGGQAFSVSPQDSWGPLPFNMRLSQADSVFSPSRSLRAGGQAFSVPAQDFGTSFPYPIQLPIADSVLGPASAPAMGQPYSAGPLNLPTSLSAPGQLGALATSPQFFTFGLQEGPVVYPTTHPALTDALAGTIESGSFSVPSSQGSSPRAIGQASAASSSLFPFGQPFTTSSQGSAWSFPTTIQLSQADSVFSPARTPRSMAQTFSVPPQASPWSFPHLVQYPMADSVLGPASAPAMGQPYSAGPLNLPTSLSAPGQLGALATSPQFFTFGLQEGPVMYPTAHPALTDALAGTIESDSLGLEAAQAFSTSVPNLQPADSVFGPGSSLRPFGQALSYSPQPHVFYFPSISTSPVSLSPPAPVSSPALQSPAPFVLQPPPPGRRAQKPPSPGAARVPEPAQLPIQAQDPQRPPDVRPKERRVLTDQEPSVSSPADALGQAQTISLQDASAPPASTQAGVPDTTCGAAGIESGPLLDSSPLHFPPARPFPSPQQLALAGPAASPAGPHVGFASAPNVLMSHTAPEGATGGHPPSSPPLVFNLSPTYLQSLAAQAYPPAPPPALLLRRNRPPPLQLPPPGPMPLDYPPLRLRQTRDGGPYFTYYSPFVFMGPRPGAQVRELPGAQVRELPPKAPEGIPRERRGADRHAMSIRISNTKPKDSKQVTMERIVGEIAFQLDRRILSTIFPDRVRLYGFNVRDLPEKIAQTGTDPHSPGLTEDERASLRERYNNLMARLKSLGYDPNIHPSFTEHIVNTYGILRERPDPTGIEGDLYNDIEFLRNVVQNIVPADQCANCMLLLNCLHLLSQEDGKPLFIW